MRDLGYNIPECCKRELPHSIQGKIHLALVDKYDKPDHDRLVATHNAKGNDAANFMFVHLDWGATPQGYDYWEKIYRELRTK